MGQVHAKALTRIMQHYRDLRAAARLVAVADPADDGRLDHARDAFGIAWTTPDWKELVRPSSGTPLTAQGRRRSTRARCRA